LIGYNRASNTCTLMCHGTAHNADGSVGTETTKKPKRTVGK
jgi:hypothetical protein